jgi:Outer membrane protein beta-barrel domain
MSRILWRVSQLTSKEIVMNERKKRILFGVILLLSAMASAQEFPKAEVGFDYSYVRYAPNVAGSQGHSLNGGGGTLVFNINRYLGIKADLQGYGSTTTTFQFGPTPNFPTGAQANVQGNLFTYLFGPQIKLHSPKIQPFVHFLFGGVHSNVYANAFKNICLPASGVCSFSRAPANNAFAFAFGGGVDIPIGHVVAIRPAEVDYLLTDFTNQFNNAHQNNFRYSGGITFSFGGGSKNQ